MRQDDGVEVDVDRVRAEFPALNKGVAHFDGPGGSQVPRSVAHAIAGSLVSGIANRGTITEAERRAEAIVVHAREAIADLLGADPAGVVFGRSMTQLTYDFARALSKQWRPGDEVIVTRLDHDANIRPWVTYAPAASATVHGADFDMESAELAVNDVARLLSGRTKLVAITGASNLLGTRPDVASIAAAAHEAGAIVYVDGVHLTPHAPVDIDALGVDLFACSPYKFFGPHLGVVAGDPILLERVEPDKLLPSSNAVPERFELGTLPYELLAGVIATVDFIANLLPGNGSRRQRVLASMAAVESYEDRLVDQLGNGLAAIDTVTMHGHPARHTPTLLFSVDGHRPREVHEYLAQRKVNAPGGCFYAVEASRWLGLGDEGAVRAGLAPYTNEDDIDRLVRAVGELASSATPHGIG
jgi:cysteine desulfurase family protein (TIGR01976 family)